MADCRNCGSPLCGEYCSRCGQRNFDFDQPIWSLLAAVVKENFEVDGRTARTISTLFRHPGMLTAEYLAGRVAAEWIRDGQPEG